MWATDEQKEKSIKLHAALKSAGLQKRIIGDIQFKTVILFKLGKSKKVQVAHKINLFAKE